MNFASAWGVAFQIGPLTVRWYGIIICCAMLIGILLAYKEVQREHLNPDDLLNLIIMIIPLALIGARAYYVILRWDYYSLYPGEIIKIWNGGSAIHGGIFLCIVGMLIYCRIKKQRFLQWADLLVPMLALGQCIGRWGNYINAEAYGPVIEAGSTWSWVPLQVYANGAYHHPIFLYESICDGLIFIALMLLIHKRHRIGSVFAWYLISYSFVRFWIEFLRQDLLMIGPIRAAQLVSVLGIIIGIIILVAIRKQPAVDVAARPIGNPKKKKKDGAAK